MDSVTSVNSHLQALESLSSECSTLSSGLSGFNEGGTLPDEISPAPVQRLRVRSQKAETKKGASVKISDLAEAKHLR